MVLQRILFNPKNKILNIKAKNPNCQDFAYYPANDIGVKAFENTYLSVVTERYGYQQSTLSLYFTGINHNLRLSTAAT